MIITLYINRTNTQNAASFKEKGKTKSQYESKKKLYNNKNHALQNKMK